jgi:hypothetical protein
MKPTDEADIIVEHALESDRNLRIASKIGLAFPKLKQVIVGDFVKVLISGLRERLGSSWILDDEWTQTPLAKGSYVSAKKAIWAEKSSIGLHCDKVGPGDLSFFVWVEPDYIKGTTIATELKAALDERYAPGRKEPRYPWWRYVDAPYGHWTNEDVLIALRQKTEALELFLNHLTTISTISEPFLDQLAKR